MSCLFLSFDFIFYFMQKLILTVDLRCCHALEITYQLDHIRIEPAFEQIYAVFFIVFIERTADAIEIIARDAHLKRLTDNFPLDRIRTFEMFESIVTAAEQIHDLHRINDKQRCCQRDLLPVFLQQFLRFANPLLMCRDQITRRTQTPFIFL